MNICYFGAGRLGLSLAVWDAHCGHYVTCVDVNEDTVKAINTGQSSIDEPQVQELLVDARVNMRLMASTDGVGVIAGTHIVFILVPTPSKPDGLFDLKYVLEVAEAIGRGLPISGPAMLVVCVSTIMPGDSRKIIEIIENESGLKCGESWHYCYSPEFIRQGSIVHDYANPDVMLIGEHSEDAGAMLEEFYLSVVVNEPEVYHMSLESAEVAKIGLNTAVVAKMAVANQLMWLCHYTPGADARDVLQSIGADPRIGHRYFCGGTWPGGPCFPRDQRALVAAGQTVEVELSVASSVGRLHEQQCMWLAEEALYHLDRIGGSTIGLLGITYKPGVSITEESQSLALSEQIAEIAGGSPLLWDPVVIGKELSWIVERSDVLVVMVKHPELSELAETDLTGKVIIDCWGILDEEVLNCAKYVRLGKGKQWS